MMPLDMSLHLTFLEDIERLCTQETTSAQSEKASTEGKKSNKQPGTNPAARVPKKACTKKHCILCKKHGSAHITHNIRGFPKYQKDGKEKANFCTANKGVKKTNPIKENVTQLSKKLDKLKKTLKKFSKKSKKCHYEDSNSDSE